MATDDPPGTTELVVPLDDGGEATLAVPATASQSECAALAAALGAHLTDRQRAALAAASDGPERTDRWKLAGRLGVRNPNRVPRSVTRGEEWKAATRTY
jgi:hypothetical protein